MHPVVWMGKAVRWAERLGSGSDARAFGVGLGMALGLPAFWAGLCWLTLQVPYVGAIFGLFWLKSSFALRVLGEAGEGVAKPLAAGDIAQARQRLSWLCSRDATQLSEQELAAGTVESLAENLSDSFVAPLFWFAVAGVPGAVAYRAVNTLDAMIGYRGRYEWLGKASARLDDVLNLIPARLTALLLLAAGVLCSTDVRGGFASLLRHRGRTESPNAGWPMSAMAGLLGVVLEKPGHYVLGSGRVPEGGDIGRAWRVCQVAAGVWAIGLIAWVGFTG